MNAITHSPFRKYQHPALLGLSEKALTALFNAGGVRMLQAQEWLFRSGEAATTGFLIFEGNVSCYRQQEPAQVAVQLLAGDYIPASLLQLEGSYTFDCKANQALTVLQLDTSAVQQMDEASQLTLHKNLMPTFNRLFTQLAQTSPSQGAALATDATAVAAALLARQAPYLSAISLQTMLANLPKLPPYSTKITSLMSDPNANTRTIVEIARQDPSLTASVLSTVNSAWFGLTHQGFPARGDDAGLQPDATVADQHRRAKHDAQHPGIPAVAGAFHDDFRAVQRDQPHPQGRFGPDAEHARHPA